MTTTVPKRVAPDFPDWGTCAREASDAVEDASIEAYWRALNYLCAAQLYLAANPRLAEHLRSEHLKAVPRGHWGVCPPVNLVLAALGPLIARSPGGSEVLVLHGAGHAGPSALANAYLNNTLNLTAHGPGWSMAELRALVSGFPHPTRFGGEITPLIPGVRHTGGQLGPALAIAQGMALDAPRRLVVPLIGDGELETGLTAAAWLGRRALLGTGEHGAVLPVVLANGLRMGGPSLLAGLTPDEIHDYFAGLGYFPLIHDGSDIRGFREMLADAFGLLRPLGEAGHPPVVVLTMPKGATGPEEVSGRQIAGTPAVHKTPLSDPMTNTAEFEALARWLASYGPTELLDTHGRPAALVRQALPGAQPTPGPSVTPPPQGVRGQAVPGVSAVIRARAAHHGFRLFSPDEIGSNRLRLADKPSPLPPWAVEVLNEELCHAWLQGYTETGRDALLATYEAFAPLNTSLLTQHLKHRLLRYRTGDAGLPSINYLITSLGWFNSYTHQNPGLASAMLELEDGFVHLYTPADSSRAAANLSAMLASRDRVNLLITDKHPGPGFAPDTFRDELIHGAAVWPHMGNGMGRPPDIVLASAGDVPARNLTHAAGYLRRTHPRTVLQYVHINDLTILGDPADRPYALADEPFAHLFGTRCPVLLAVPTYRPAVHALLASRSEANRFHVVGYRDPGGPTTPQDLLTHCGMSAEALATTATELIEEAGS
ncbi:phosphoketolase [Embleya sp. NBC_00888]|uniref:phosphoketolase family protein n=1 Tax=Embleya sp. NBC_00888 TaxID=2975960 RepID=UPI0038664149|nr:phosphoketolase [Embleya sp. NBC_00888]